MKVWLQSRGSFVPVILVWTKLESPKIWIQLVGYKSGPLTVHLCKTIKTYLIDFYIIDMFFFGLFWLY